MHRENLQQIRTEHLLLNGVDSQTNVSLNEVYQRKRVADGLSSSLGAPGDILKGMRIPLYQHIQHRMGPLIRPSGGQQFVPNASQTGHSNYSSTQGVFGQLAEPFL